MRTICPKRPTPTLQASGPGASLACCGNMDMEWDCVFASEVSCISNTVRASSCKRFMLYTLFHATVELSRASSSPSRRRASFNHETYRGVRKKHSVDAVVIVVVRGGRGRWAAWHPPPPPSPARRTLVPFSAHPHCLLVHLCTRTDSLHPPPSPGHSFPF